MRLITCLFVFISFNVFAQDKLPWFGHDLKSFEVSLMLPGPPLEEEDKFGDLYAKYESVESVDPINHSTFKLLAIHHRGFYEKRSDEAFYKDLTKVWANSNKHEIIRSDYLEVNGINVMRGVVKVTEKETSFSAWQITKIGGNVFIQTINHEQGDFNKKDVVHFFESLKIDDKGEQEMHHFQNLGAAISFDVPIKPQFKKKVRVREDIGEERPLHIYTFLANDKFEQYNYLMIYRNNPPGIVFEDLDSDFLEFQEVYETAFKAKAKNVNRTMFKGYPASEMNFDIKGGSKVHIFIVVRGNKLYVFMIEQMKGGLNFGDKKSAFHESIKFLPLDYLDLKKNEVEEDYSIGFPTEAGVEETELYTYPFTHYVDHFSLDTLSGLGYSLSEYQLSPYYSTENYDSLLQADKDSLMVLENLMSCVDTTFQNGKAWHMKRFSSDSDMVINDLIFYRGPHYIELTVCGSSETPDSVVWKYFNSFEMKVEGYTDDYIRKDKRDKLWLALESRDSATLEEAKNAFRNSKFKAIDLSKIYHLLEKDIAYDTLGYENLHESLLSGLDAVNDETTLPFLQNLFNANKGKPALRKSILDAFMALKTKEAIQVFFDHAKVFDIKDDNDFNYWTTFYPLRDSLELAIDFTLDLMNLVDHEAMDYEVMDLLNDMYLDTTITVDTPDFWSEKLLKKGNTIITDHELLTKDSIIFEGDVYQLRIIDELLGYLSPSEVPEKFITDQFKINDTYHQTNAIKAAFKLDFTVPDSILIQLFESKHDGYNLMQIIADDGLINKIPRELYDQDYVVEGIFKFNATYDYGAVENFELLQKRNIIKNKKKYILHVVQFDLLDYEVPQVGICTQPWDEEQVSIKPDYYNYDDWDKASGSRKEFVKGLIQGFVDLDQE